MPGKVDGFAVTPARLRAIRKNRRPQAAGARSVSGALFAAGEIFPDGGLNGPARDLRDERHAGMVTASMNSWRKSAMAFPSTEFTAANDGLIGTRLHKNRQFFGLQSCREHVRNVSCLPYAGIGAPAKRYRCPSVAAGSETNPTPCMPCPFRPHAHSPSAPDMQEGWRCSLPLGAIVSAAFSPPGSATIVFNGARLGRRC